jgi:hypothetical protein
MLTKKWVGVVNVFVLCALPCFQGRVGGGGKEAHIIAKPRLEDDAFRAAFHSLPVAAAGT